MKIASIRQNKSRFQKTPGSTEAEPTPLLIHQPILREEGFRVSGGAKHLNDPGIENAYVSVTSPDITENRQSA